MTKKQTPPPILLDSDDPSQTRKAVVYIIGKMRRCAHDDDYHGWAFMLGNRLRNLMQRAYDANDLVARTASKHPRAKDRCQAAADADRELAAVARKVWAMPVRHEQDLVNRALIADYHADRNADGSLIDLASDASPPDVAHAHLTVAVLARNGIEPGSWGPARGRRSITAARGQA